MGDITGVEILHTGLAVPDEETAHEVFEGLFGLEPAGGMEIPGEITEALFRVGGGARIMHYRADNAMFEIFIRPGVVNTPGGFGHVCLIVRDRDAVIEKAESMGFEIRRYTGGNRDVAFVVDRCGNIYEIKQARGNV